MADRPTASWFANKKQEHERNVRNPEVCSEAISRWKEVRVFLLTSRDSTPSTYPTVVIVTNAYQAPSRTPLSSIIVQKQKNPTLAHWN